MTADADTPDADPAALGATLREAAQTVMDSHRKGYWNAAEFDDLEAALSRQPEPQEPIPVPVAAAAGTRDGLRELALAATPGPWFWNSYSGVFSAPVTQEYNRLEALIPDDAPDAAYEHLPETRVAVVGPSGHGDLSTKQGAIDGQYIAAASPDVILALIERAAIRAEAPAPSMPPAASSYPHRGSWRHANWCSWERGSETECICELDDARRSLIAVAPVGDGLRATSTRELADALAAGNPWFTMTRDKWLAMAAGLQDYLDALALTATEDPDHAAG